MKNQADDSTHTKKNSEFFDKLDKDRKAKKCEYAVLVTLLEPDSEFYNQGIVDVGYEYEKMFVIRPQFFLPIIGFLRNASLNALDYKRQLALAKQQTVDVTTFENDVEEFKRLFLKHTRLAAEKHQSAIDNINKVIGILESVKSSLEGSDKNLGHAEKKLDDLSVKKLTRRNPTMAELFEDARAAQAEADGDAIPLVAEILED